MSKHFSYLKKALFTLGISLFTFTVARICFYIFNQSLFESVSFLELLKALFWGIRFDISSLTYVNALLLISFLIPIKARENIVYKNVQIILFAFTSFFSLLIEFIDIGYYKYAFRRTMLSDFSMMGNNANNFGDYVKEYWYLALILLALTYLAIVLFRKVQAIKTAKQNGKTYSIILFVIGVLFFAICARGGIQLRPIMPLTAAAYTQHSKLVHLISNTTLSLIFSVQQRSLEKKNYYSKDELKSIFTTSKHYQDTTAFNPLNVIIITMESFGKEVIPQYNDGIGFTPFLDSLLNHSFTREHSYANGLRSTQGIAAIASGIPSLMLDPLMFSAYQSNQLDGIAKLLGNKGYQSAFFHGSNPGSMEFESFGKLAGFDKHYDKTNFPDQNQYDGNWGIWDIPFFEFTVDELNTFKEPFVSLLFSLTSHHPYAVEDWFAKKYPNMPIKERSIRYADEALRIFFEKAKKTAWYDNTLFVIVADHVGASDDIKYQNLYGRYKIPIAFYRPNDSLKNRTKGLIQQADIIPSILDYLNYDLPFKSYGKSIFQKKEDNYAYILHERGYQILDDQYLLLFDGSKSTHLFNYISDPKLSKNIIDKNVEVKERFERQIKAIIQTYHEEMIENKIGNR